MCDSEDTSQSTPSLEAGTAGLAARIAVNRMIDVYLIDHANRRQTYTDIHDNALREVLYNQEERLRNLEALLALKGEST